MTARALTRIAADLTEMVEQENITPEALRLAARRLDAQAEMIEVGCESAAE